MLKKIDVKYYLLAFLDTFSIWQMGIIFYSSKTLTINNLVNTPVNLSNSIVIVFIGYIIGILAVYLFPKKTILMGRSVILLSLIATILLFFNISATLFSILYYILTFCCVFFISINMSLIINYYSLKTALVNTTIEAILAPFIIAICQNNIFPLSFAGFNIVSLGCLSLMSFALLRIPLNHNIKFVEKNNKIEIPPKKKIIGIALIQLVTCLLTVFSSSMAEAIRNGVSLTYLGGVVAGIVFLLFNKRFKISAFKITKYYFAITSIGFVIYLLPFEGIKYLSLFLQGFNFFIIVAAPFLISHLFEIYPSKIIAPLTTVLALISVFISSSIIEAFRNNPNMLYSLFAVISVLATIIFLVMEQEFNFEYYNKKVKFNGLTEREKDVANLLIKGFSVKEIAKSLYLSEHTVKDYTKNIYRKYEIHSKYELINKVNSQAL